MSARCEVIGLPIAGAVSMIVWLSVLLSFFFFFNDTATTEIYTLSLHDALPISRSRSMPGITPAVDTVTRRRESPYALSSRSEEHTSELQSPCNLVCRLLLEKKKKTTDSIERHARLGPSLKTRINPFAAATTRQA